MANKYYKCPKCDYYNKKKIEIEFHQMLEDHYETFICKSCNFISHDKRRYQNHFISFRHLKSKNRLID